MDQDTLTELQDCYDSWASGAWPESNAQANLDYVMSFIETIIKEKN